MTRDVGDYFAHAGPDERWVCLACGKYTPLGAQRSSFGDTACITHAVRCRGERGTDGRWVAVVVDVEPEVGP